MWSQNLKRQGFLSLAGMKAVNAWRLSNYPTIGFPSMYNFTLNSSQGLKPSPLFLALVAVSSGQLDQCGVISKTGRHISNTGGAPKLTRSRMSVCPRGYVSPQPEIVRSTLRFVLLRPRCRCRHMDCLIC